MANPWDVKEGNWLEKYWNSWGPGGSSNPMMGGFLSGLFSPKAEQPVPPDINSPMYQYGGGKGIDQWIQSQLAALQQGAGRDFSQATDAIAGNALMHGTYDSSVPGGQAGQAQSTIQANLANAMAGVMGQGQEMKMNAWGQGMSNYSNAYQKYLDLLNNQQDQGGMDIGSLISLLINFV